MGASARSLCRCDRLTRIERARDPSRPSGVARSRARAAAEKRRSRRCPRCARPRGCRRAIRGSSGTSRAPCRGPCSSSILGPVSRTATRTCRASLGATDSIVDLRPTRSRAVAEERDLFTPGQQGTRIVVILPSACIHHLSVRRHRSLVQCPRVSPSRSRHEMGANDVREAIAIEAAGSASVCSTVARACTAAAGAGGLERVRSTASGMSNPQRRGAGADASGARHAALDARPDLAPAGAQWRHSSGSKKVIGLFARRAVTGIASGG